jgi:hypothetical protein
MIAVMLTLGELYYSRVQAVSIALFKQQSDKLSALVLES